MFEDITSDTAVLELLQDIPPEWGAWTAGAPLLKWDRGPPVGPTHAHLGSPILAARAACSQHLCKPVCPISPPQPLVATPVWPHARLAQSHPAAGWDAGWVEPGFSFLDVSQPMGDSQKIASGK